MAEEKFTTETVLSIRRWSNNLFSFTLTRPAQFRFTAGQFARIGLPGAAPDGVDPPIFRAYSIVSSPYADCLEFFSIVVPGGAFTSRLQDIRVGDPLFLEKNPYGFLTLTRFQQPQPQDLWLMATGTGLAPFLAILQDFAVWQDYRCIVLAYSVRYAQELAYAEEIEQIARDFSPATGGATFKFLPIITREPAGCLNLRLPVLIANGQLEQQAGIGLNPASSHVMLCGNPQMVEDTRQALKDRGLSMNRRGEGNIAVENYW